MPSLQPTPVRFAGRFWPSRAERQKTVLFSTDVDHTLLGWLSDNEPHIDQQALLATRRVLEQNRDNVAVHLNTGRGLTAIKDVAPLLKNIPVDYLSLDNGQELYINRRHKEASRWINSLTPSDQVRFVKKNVRQSGWDTRTAMATLVSVLSDHGFRQERQPFVNHQFPGVRRFHALVNGQRVTVDCYNDQSGLYIGPNIPLPDGSTIGDTLMNNWLARLQRAGMNPTCEQFESGKDPESGIAHHAIYMMFPPGINKASVIRRLIEKRLPHLKGVITAGDSATNDYDFVSPAHYMAHKTELPNYPIVSGTSSTLAGKLNGHPRVLVAPTAQLDPALRMQIGRILNMQA